MPFPYAAAALALQAGNTAYGIFNQKRPQVPDIGAELAKIRALFDEARAAARKGIEEDFNTQRGQQLQGLAARGTLTSPIAQGSLDALGKARGQAIARSEGMIAGQSAQTQSSLLAALLGTNLAAQKVGMEQDAATAGGISSIAAALLNYGANKKPATPTTPSYNPVPYDTSYNPILQALYPRP